MSALKASVIIPTKGRDTCLRQTLRDLGAQDMEPGTFDVWVVDQNEPALTGLAEDLGPAVKLHHRPMKPEGSHAGRNTAIAETSAPLCIFVDDDVRLPPHFVSAHVTAQDIYRQQAPAVAVVAGRVIQPNDGLTEEDMIRGGELAKYHRITGRVTGNFVGFELGFVDHIHECNFSALTSVLRQAGGFNEEFQGNAYFYGVDLCQQIVKSGRRIIYRPDIVLTHLQEGSGGNRVHRKAEHTYWYMRNLGLLNSLHMSAITMPLFATLGAGYVTAKAVKNWDASIAMEGFKGLARGLAYFAPGAQRRKSRAKP
jgi:glycosyltransferase involved in cell wall biosynthesis